MSDTDAVIDAFGKNEQVKNVYTTNDQLSRKVIAGKKTQSCD